MILKALFLLSISLSAEERSKVEEEGKYFLAMRLVQAGKLQEAIQALGELKSPEASFQRAMVSDLIYCISYIDFFFLSS